MNEDRPYRIVISDLVGEVSDESVKRKLQEELGNVDLVEQEIEADFQKVIRSRRGYSDGRLGDYIVGRETIIKLRYH